MIKVFLGTTAAALTLIGAAVVSSPPALAQVGIEIGPGGARVYEDRPRYERRVIERRPSRRVMVEDDDDQVCETRTRRVRVDGVWRTRRVTVCE